VHVQKQIKISKHFIDLWWDLSCILPPSHFFYLFLLPIKGMQQFDLKTGRVAMATDFLYRKVISSRLVLVHQ